MAKRTKPVTDLKGAQKALGAFEDGDLPDAAEIAAALGIPEDCVDMYDSCIDDGSDDGINEYVMKDCYTIELAEYSVTARFYYGDVDNVVGWVNVQ